MRGTYKVSSYCLALPSPNACIVRTCHSFYRSKCIWHTSARRVPVSMAGGLQVAVLISLQEEQSSTKGDLDEPVGWRSRNRMKLYGIECKDAHFGN